MSNPNWLPLTSSKVAQLLIYSTQKRGDLKNYSNSPLKIQILPPRSMTLILKIYISKAKLLLMPDLLERNGSMRPRKKPLIKLGLCGLITVSVYAHLKPNSLKFVRGKKTYC